MPGMYDVNAYEMYLKSAGAGKPLAQPLAEASYTQMLEREKYKRTLIERADKELMDKKTAIATIAKEIGEKVRNPNNPMTAKEGLAEFRARCAIEGISTNNFNKIYPMMEVFFTGIERQAETGLIGVAEPYSQRWKAGAEAYHKGEMPPEMAPWPMYGRVQKKETLEEYEKKAKIRAKYGRDKLPVPEPTEKIFSDDVDEMNRLIGLLADFDAVPWIREKYAKPGLYLSLGRQIDKLLGRMDTHQETQKRRLGQTTMTYKNLARIVGITDIEMLRLQDLHDKNIPLNEYLEKIMTFGRMGGGGAGETPTDKRIRVREKSTGETGTIPEDEFNPNLYEKI